MKCHPVDMCECWVYRFSKWQISECLDRGFSMDHDVVRKGGISINKDVNGTICYAITFDPDFGPPDFEGTMDAMMDAIELHHRKALDYDGDESQFGIKGELIGITRKVGKLKRIWWDGRDPLFEGAQELIMDLIGNCLLALRMQKAQISDKYSASWRDNHSNRPTFGPGPGDREPGNILAPDPYYPHFNKSPDAPEGIPSTRIYPTPNPVILHQGVRKEREI